MASYPAQHETFAADPKIQLRSLTDQRADFILSNVSLSFANALRRVIIAEVPTVAIDTVEIMNNTTVLPDEMLAHRLGMIPLISTGVTQSLRDQRVSRVTRRDRVREVEDPIISSIYSVYLTIYLRIAHVKLVVIDVP